MCLNNAEKNILKREPDSAELSSQEHSLLRYQESECMLLLDEKIKGYPSLIDKWQMDLLQVYLPLEEAERKMKVFYNAFDIDRDRRLVFYENGYGCNGAVLLPYPNLGSSGPRLFMSGVEGNGFLRHES